jgi:hypothetical protein
MSRATCYRIWRSKKNTNRSRIYTSITSRVGTRGKQADGRVTIGLPPEREAPAETLAILTALGCSARSTLPAASPRSRERRPPELPLPLPPMVLAIGVPCCCGGVRLYGVGCVRVWGGRRRGGGEKNLGAFVRLSLVSRDEGVCNCWMSANITVLDIANLRQSVQRYGTWKTNVQNTCKHFVQQTRNTFATWRKSHHT